MNSFQKKTLKAVKAALIQVYGDRKGKLTYDSIYPVVQEQLK